MVINTVTEAKAHLSAILERVSRGEQVIISRAGKPIAILKPYSAEQHTRIPGALRGKIKIADDFNELPSDMAQALGMIDG